MMTHENDGCSWERRRLGGIGRRDAGAIISGMNACLHITNENIATFVRHRDRNLKAKKPIPIPIPMPKG